MKLVRIDNAEKGVALFIGGLWSVESLIQNMTIESDYCFSFVVVESDSCFLLVLEFRIRVYNASSISCQSHDESEMPWGKRREQSVRVAPQDGLWGGVVQYPVLCVSHCSHDASPGVFPMGDSAVIFTGWSCATSLSLRYSK